MPWIIDVQCAKSVHKALNSLFNEQCSLSKKDDSFMQSATLICYFSQKRLESNWQLATGKHKLELIQGHVSFALYDLSIYWLKCAFCVKSLRMRVLQKNIRSFFIEIWYWYWYRNTGKLVVVGKVSGIQYKFLQKKLLAKCSCYFVISRRKKVKVNWLNQHMETIHQSTNRLIIEKFKKLPIE